MLCTVPLSLRDNISVSLTDPFECAKGIFSFYSAQTVKQDREEIVAHPNTKVYLPLVVLIANCPLFQDVPNPEISFLQCIFGLVRCSDRLAHLPLPLGGGTPGVGSCHRVVDAHSVCGHCHRFRCSVNHKSEEVFTSFQDRRKMVEKRPGRLQKLQRVCPGVLR